MLQDDDDTFPRYSYDLVDFLDINVQRPSFPVTANQFRDLDEAQVRSAAFTAGARSIVDMLIDWRTELDAEDETPIQDGSVLDEAAPVFPRLFDTSGRVREVISSIHVAGDTSGHELDD